MKNFDYWKIPKFIPESVCDFLINTYGNWQVGRVGYSDPQSDINVRDSSVAWIVDNFWCSNFYKIMSDVNKESGWNMDLESVESLQLTRYNAPAGHYDYHIDGNGYEKIPDTGLVRKLSMSCLLNHSDEFEGGNLGFMLGSDNKFEVEMNKGDCVLFPSFYLHRVTPVTKGTRYSMVVWATGKQFR